MASVTAYTAITGDIAYTYNHEVHWCWDGDTVLSVSQDRDYLTNEGAFFYWAGTVDEWTEWGQNDIRYSSYMEGKVDNCIPYFGCQASYYPWIRVDVYGDGGNRSRGDAG